jgi:hypothetical protein
VWRVAVIVAALAPRLIARIVAKPALTPTTLGE